MLSTRLTPPSLYVMFPPNSLSGSSVLPPALQGVPRGTDPRWVLECGQVSRETVPPPPPRHCPQVLPPASWNVGLPTGAALGTQPEIQPWGHPLDWWTGKRLKGEEQRFRGSGAGWQRGN